MENRHTDSDDNMMDARGNPEIQHEALLFLELQLREAEKSMESFKDRLDLDDDLDERARSIENQKVILVSQLKILEELNDEEEALNLERALKERIKAAEVRINTIDVSRQPGRERLDEYWQAKAQYDICSSLLSHWWNWLANGELKLL